MNWVWKTITDCAEEARHLTDRLAIYTNKDGSTSRADIIVLLRVCQKDDAWYASVNGEEEGPFSTEEVAKKNAEGRAVKNRYSALDGGPLAIEDKDR